MALIGEEQFPTGWHVHGGPPSPSCTEEEKEEEEEEVRISRRTGEKEEAWRMRSMRKKRGRRR